MTSSPIERARAAWKNRGGARPHFALDPMPGQESVWDYPRPPRVESVSLPVKVAHAGETIAETNRALRVVETAGAPVYYIPPEHVEIAVLIPSEVETLCEWKGRARYWAVRVGDRSSERAAFAYPNPFEGFELIAGYIAFYAGRVDACFVGNERATPQPGGFYAGWVTSNIVGPFKGEPGTEQW